LKQRRSPETKPRRNKKKNTESLQEVEVDGKRGKKDPGELTKITIKAPPEKQNKRGTVTLKATREPGQTRVKEGRKERIKEGIRDP